MTQYDLQQAVLHERELRETNRQETARAIELYQTEVARRLDVLNHAHREAMENWARSLPRELFDAYVSEQDRRTAELKNMVATLAARQDTRMEKVGLDINTMQVRNATWMAALGVLMAGVSIAGTVVSIAVAVALKVFVP